MSISVQLNESEIKELRQQALSRAKEMADWLEQNTAAPDYFQRMKKLRELIAQLDHWELEGINIAIENHMAGRAVDQINAATEALERAAQRVAAIGSKVDVFTAFVDLIVAISGGKPDDIIKGGIALARAADNAK